MLDLLEAVVTRVKAAPFYLAALPGGVHLGKAPKDTAMPYAVIDVVSGTPVYATGDDRATTAGLRFSFYGAKLADVRTAVAAWKDGFDGQQFATAEGPVIGADLTAERSVFEEADEQLLSAWHHMLEFDFYVS